MTWHRIRTVCRRLTVELAVVVLLAGLPVDVPRGTSAGSAWSFLLRHPSLLAHAVLGAVILLEALAFAVCAVRPGRDRGAGVPAPAAAPAAVLAAVLALLGAGCVAVSVASGVQYVGGGQRESSLTWMTAGWLGALTGYVVGWVVGHRAEHRSQTVQAR